MIEGLSLGVIVSIQSQSNLEYILDSCFQVDAEMSVSFWFSITMKPLLT